MRSLKVLAIAAALALCAVPALAIADKPAEPGQGNGNGPQYETAPPGPGAGLPEKAKAYGRYCQGQSKKHIKGEKGTPYSRCVKGAAKMLG